MPISKGMNEIVVSGNDKGIFIDNKYRLAHEVAKLQKDYEFILCELGSLLATLQLERNRENLRKGEGLEELVEIVDRVAETIKKENKGRSTTPA